MQTAANTPNSTSEGVEAAEPAPGRGPAGEASGQDSERSPDQPTERAESRALVLARDVRERTLRRQRVRRSVFIGVVFTTLAAVLGWGLWLAPHRYAAETRFSVRGTAVTAVSGGASLLGGTSGGPTAGFVDGFAVNDFLKSRDCMKMLAAKVDLPALLDVDPQAGGDALYKAYRSAVSTKFNMIEQENVLVVSAFSPQASEKIATNLVAMSQDFVNRMDAQGVQNMLDVDAAQLRKAEDDAAKATNAVASWRASNRNLDPEAETALVMTMIGQIEQELNTAKINYEKIKAFGNPQHPMLESAQMQVAALQRQLDEARGRLTNGANSQASQLRTYTQLKAAETFAMNNLTAAREAYQRAYLETSRLRRYLSVISRPVAQDVPSTPDLWLLLLEGSLGGILLALAVMALIDFRRPTSD